MNFLKKRLLVKVLIISNFALLGFCAWMLVFETSAYEIRKLDSDFVVPFMIVLLVLGHLYVLIKYINNTPDTYTNVFMLYIKRRRLEEEQKIKNLEKD